MCCDTVNRGLAFADGKIFLHQADTTLVALDAKTGAVVWSVKDGDPSKGETGTDAPHVFKDKVYIGVSGGEFGVRGWLSAYNIKDGKLAWRAYSEGPDSGPPRRPREDDGARQADRQGFFPQDLAKAINGRSAAATTWGWYSYDPELNLVYLRLGQSLDLESEAAARRQQMVDDHLGARR